jgi:hypothetical protein
MDALSSAQQPDTRLVLHALIDYVPMDKPRQFNQSQVTVNRFNSVFYMHRVDEVNALQVCQLMAYFLRARFDVSFDREPGNENELAGRNLFYSLKDFQAYYDLFKTFVMRMYEQNQKVADQFEVYINERVQLAEETGVEDNTVETLKQFRVIRKLFTDFFAGFANDKFDPAILYERMFLDRSASAPVSLVIPMETMGSLETMFDRLCYLNINAIDHCNSAMPVIVSSGFVIYAILYLCGGSDMFSDSSVPLVWGKVNSSSEGMPQWLHTQTESKGYREEVEHLPRELFNGEAGDVYVNKHDFISTLLAQTLNRLFTRLIEWPVREDVSVWIREFLTCENIHQFFNAHGRCGQLWICFRKKRDYEQKEFPSVYVSVNKLNALYDKIGLASKKSSGPATEGDVANLVSNAVAGGGQQEAEVQLPPEDVIVRQRLDELNRFKRLYAEFWVKGIRRDGGSVRDTYAKICRDFVLATGGYNGSKIEEHSSEVGHAPVSPEHVLMSTDLQSVVYRDCQCCSSYLAPSTIPDMFSVERWVSQMSQLIFPYNFVSLPISADKDYSDETLQSCVIFKLLESFAVRRLTVDRAQKMLAFFFENRPLCSFLVSQSDMVALWTKAMQRLTFFKEFLGGNNV